LLDGHLLHCNELVFQVVEKVIIDAKLPLQGPVRHPAVFPQHGNRLRVNLVEVHSSASASRQSW
jgi:hypothetical protein